MTDPLAGHILTLNAGSSSIKYALFAVGQGAGQDALRLTASGMAEMIGEAQTHLRVTDAQGQLLHETSWQMQAGAAFAEGQFHQDALQRILDWQQRQFAATHLVAVGHRVVHGGAQFDHPIRITDAALDHMRALAQLAPLHQPYNITGIEAARAIWPHAAQIACFDTAFHCQHSFIQNVYALPRQLYEEGVRRYGFHGLSYEYVMTQLRVLAPQHAHGRVVIAHLGNGASMCAIQDGVSVASTMGFTALDGLPMGTRCGQLDPGVVLYLLQAKGMSAEAVADMLYHQSGLKGLSGISADMRTLEASPESAAQQAIACFTLGIRRELGGLAAMLHGLDAIVFCGGIGENSWRIREQALADMAWLGIELDNTANRHGGPVISAAHSRVLALVIPTNEEAMIAQHTLALLATAQPV